MTAQSVPPPCQSTATNLSQCQTNDQSLQRAAEAQTTVIGMRSSLQATTTGGESDMVPQQSQHRQLHTSAQSEGQDAMMSQLPFISQMMTTTTTPFPVSTGWILCKNKQRTCPGMHPRCMQLIGTRYPGKPAMHEQALRWSQQHTTQSGGEQGPR